MLPVRGRLSAVRLRYVVAAVCGLGLVAVVAVVGAGARSTAGNGATASAGSSTSATSATGGTSSSAPQAATSSGGPSSSSATQTAGHTAAAGTSGSAAVPAARYRLWMAIGTSPTSAQLAAAAGKFAVVVLNTWDVSAARALRARDPVVQLLAYQDMSSVRVYDGSKAPATGVSYSQALANGWLARDTNGDPIPWSGYNGHLQAATWNADYRQQWMASAVRTARTAPWNGIFADNDMWTLAFYSHDVVQGTTSAAATDALIRSSLDALVVEAGAALHGVGRVLVPNYSDGRNDLARWARHARWGGAQDENFVSWSRDGTPDVWAWGGSDWSSQRAEVSTGPRTLTITQAAPGDTRTMTYGYATFLLNASPGDAWTANVTATYAQLPVAIPAQSIRLGPPSSTARSHGGAWSRTFMGGWVAVNPTKSVLSVPVPAGMEDSRGRTVTVVRLAALSGVVLARR